MKSLFIMKPDMLIDQNSVDYFIENIKLIPIDVIASYKIKDFPNLCKYLYETDDKKQKIKMLTTIRGYYDLYDRDAILVLVDVDDDNLEDLVKFKMEFRKKFVYTNTDKHYLKFQERVDISKPLSTISISNLQVSYNIVPFSQEVKENGYNLCHFNKLHCPDGNVLDTNKDLEVIDSYGIIKEKNKINIMR